MSINKEEKHEISNAQRLAALRQRRQEKSAQLKQISSALKNNSLKNNRVVFSDDVINDYATNSVQDKAKHKKEKVCLFDTQDSGPEEDGSDVEFNIQHQFEGEKGQRLFELNAAMPDERYKCDIRFKPSDDETDSSDGEELEENTESSLSMETNERCEKDKNMEILEQVLNYKIAPKPPVEAKKRKYIRFDPESETASEFIQQEKKEVEDSKIPKKKRKLKEKEEAKPEPVVSKERYFEVATDLKKVLEAPKESFSLSAKFNLTSEQNQQEKNLTNIQITQPRKGMVNRIIGVQRTTTSNQRKGAFFVGPEDDRLKIGIEFFKRTSSKEEIKEHWFRTRDTVREVLRKNRKVALKTKLVRVSQKQKYARNNRKFGKR